MGYKISGKPFPFKNPTPKHWQSKHTKCLAVLAGCSKVELAYLSGLIDGEGTLTFQKIKGGYFRPLMNITNTDEDLIVYLHRFFWQAVKKSKNSRQVPYLRVALNGFGIEPFLKAVEPFLTAKKLQCMLLRRYIACRQAQPWRASPTDEMLGIIQDVRMLNVRGARSPELKRAVREKYSA
jgi:hypothetical protein